MKELNLNQSEQVSGGNDALVVGIGCLTAVNFVWNMSQQGMINQHEHDILDLIMFSLYNDAQLQMLPHYDEVSNRAPSEILYSS